MPKHRLMGVVFAALLAVPAVGVAHEGHAHKVMGTIASIDGKHVVLRTTDGKSAMVMLDDKTTITAGKSKVALSALKVGDRIVAEGPERKSMIMATSVRIGAALAATSKKDVGSDHTEAH